MDNDSAIGLVLGSAIGPDRLAGAARLAEDLGFDEVWLAEDFFFTGGISGAGIALASTQRITVGVGVVSAMVRHPALLAMELSTVAAAYPGRLIPGIGLGVPVWVRQMNLHPSSPLSALRECVTSVKRLLAGDELTSTGPTFSFHNVKLTYPLDRRLPIHMGVIGPKMLQLSGEVADGSILSVVAGEPYVRWARKQIDVGLARAGRSDHHRLTVFAVYSVDEDGDRAREAVRGPLAFYITAGGRNALTDLAGVSDRLENMATPGGAEQLRREMPEEWVRNLTVSGTPEECAAAIRLLYSAGAESVALFPMPSEDAERIVGLTAEKVLPLL